MKAFNLTAMMMIGLLVMTLAALPSSASVVGMDKVTGDGWDLYGPPGDEVNNMALFLVVNYRDVPVTVTVEMLGNSTTELHTRTVAGGSSQYVQLTFPVADRQYRLVLHYGEEQVHATTYTRPSHMVQFPPNVWLPPGIYDPPEQPRYTEAEWQELIDAFRSLIADMTVELISLASLAALAGFAAGVMVKTKMKFVAPTDPVSVTIVLGGVGDLIMGFSPIGIYWVPILIGYVVGYIIYHIQWVGKGTIDYESQTVKVTPYVTYYTEDSQLAIQEQTWRGLLSRMAGHHHILGTDGALAENWVCAVKKPYWPLISSRLLWVEREETETETQKGRLLTIKKKASRWVLADASTARKIDLLTKAELLGEQNEERRRDKMELVRLRADKEASALKSVGRIFREVQHYSVLSSLDDLVSNDPVQQLPGKEKMTNTDKIETETKKKEEEKEG